MKTIWPSGLALLAVTEISLVGVSIVFMDWLRHGDFILLHLLFIALFLRFPANLWFNRIEIDRHLLRFKSQSGTHCVFVNTIEHIYLTPQGRSYILSIHPRNRPPHKFNIDFFRREEIINLLNDLTAKNAQINIVAPQNF